MNESAFPRIYQFPDPDDFVNVSGMSLRDWFATFAPPTPELWFNFIPEQMPMANPAWKWCEGCKADSDCDKNANCAELREYNRLCAEVQRRNQRRKLISWRFAWADEMLEFRKQTH